MNSAMEWSKFTVHLSSMAETHLVDCICIHVFACSSQNERMCVSLHITYTEGRDVVAVQRVNCFRVRLAIRAHCVTAEQ